MKLRSHWRDCKAWQDERLPLTTASNECCKLYDAALTQYVGWYDDDTFGGLDSTLEKLVSVDPSFVMGKALSVGLEMIGTGATPRLDESLRQNIESVVDMSQNCSITDRERRHVSAIKLFSDGYMMKAAETWEEILVDHPTDMLAIKFVHDTYFLLGKQAPMRDSIARVLPHWNAHIPLYSYLMGMHSFGLVETNFYKKAEDVARQGLQMNKNDAWATHALAHVLEMECRPDEGILFLSQTVNDWEPCGMLACHNFWHWAVYHLEKGETEAALDLFDECISKKVKQSQGALLDIVDAASVLYRLELEGVDPGKERWQKVYEFTEQHKEDHILLFNDSHILMSFLGTDQKLAQQFLTSAKKFSETTDTDNAKATSTIGNNLMESMVAYNDGRYDDVVCLLHPLRYDLVKIGGSNAQRDVFDQLLINASIRSTKHCSLAIQLLYERKALRPNSSLTDRLISRALSIHTK